MEPHDDLHQEHPDVPHRSDDDRTAARAVEASAVEILEAVAVVESRRFHLNRMLWLALHDLGLLDVVGRDWITAHEETFSFAELDHRQVRRLVERLQELTRTRTRTPRPTRPAGQMEFRFEPRTVPLPVDHHHPLLGVGR